MERKITLAGKEYDLPLFAPRQNRVVVPTILRLQNLNPMGINTEQYDDLVEIAYLAAQKAGCTLKRDEFMDQEITTEELLLAFPMIAKATGMLRENAAPGKPDPAMIPTGIE